MNKKPNFAKIIKNKMLGLKKSELISQFDWDMYFTYDFNNKFIDELYLLLQKDILGQVDTLIGYAKKTKKIILSFYDLSSLTGKNRTNGYLVFKLLEYLKTINKDAFCQFTSQYLVLNIFFCRTS